MITFPEGEELLLIWHIEHASYLIETPQNSIISPAFNTPRGDTWRMILKPKGLRRGDPCECRIVYESGRDPMRIARSGQVFLQTPKVISMGFFMRRLPIVEGGEITCNLQYDGTKIPVEGGDDDRVTIEIRLWMNEGACRKPAQLQAISTLQLTPLVFAASCDGTGINKELILDEPVRGHLKLGMWSPDGDRWGLIVHLGQPFQGVQSMKATFILAHRSPIDPKGIILTNIERTVMFHRWNGGTSFRVPPFFPKGPAIITCEFKSFSGDMNDRVEELPCEDWEMLWPRPLEWFYGVDGAAAATTEQQQVKVIVDVEEQREESRRSRSVLMRSLLARMDKGKFGNTFAFVLVLVLALTLIYIAWSLRPIWVNWESS